MRPYAVAAAMLVLLSVAPVRAAGVAWWEDSGIQKRVGLTARQVERLQSIFGRDLTHRAMQRRELARLERELADALAADDVAGIAGSHLVDRIEQLRMQINVRRTMMLIEMYRVLSKDQRRTLAAVRGPLIVADR